jgi:uncharacterized membrane protein
LTSHRPLDPYPFAILGLFATLEAILLALFILSAQSRMTMLAERRAHLDLQISLLVEAQNTKALSLLRALTRRFNLSEASDQDLQAMIEETDVPGLNEAVKSRLTD